MSNWGTIFVLFVSVLATGLITFLFRKFFTKIRHYLTTIGVSFVLSLICIHLLPEIFHNDVPNVGAYLLLGFVFQIILELFSRGIEHGHVHHHEDSHEHSINRTLASMFFGLCVHSLIEGIPLFILDAPVVHDGHVHHVINESGNFSSIFFWAIMGHKIPVAIVLMLFLIHSKLSKIAVFGLFVLFAIMTPIGGVIGLYIGNSDYISSISTILLAITTGMLIHITTLLVFEEYHNQKDKLKNIALIIIGLVFGLFVFV